MTVSPHKEHTWIPDQTFPINVFFVSRIGLHWHDHIEWIFVKEGRARIQIDADFETLQQGELAFVNSRQLHSAVDLEPGTEMICIVFNEALVRGSGLDITEHHYFLPYLNQHLKWPGMIRRTDPLMQSMNESFARLVDEFKGKQPGYELLVKAELLRIFGQYFRYAQQFEGLKAPRLANAPDFSGLLQTLRERYNEPISVDEAARMVNLSPNYFCKVFKQVTGKTLIEYLHLLRVQEAERLLLDTDASVTEIADKVGFSNMTYFGRVFKKIKDSTPSDIRRRNLAAR
ncbi:helix-turn-helix domain-containing protein [Paenibacillus nasutitermitis]|uniref:AraC family transcriptional regulator n=1 Tax=Paenibacillus nasutitermitis TaxID=1652958 RepID=A0A916YMM1_9BACL|nr:AraC family transcriptional regulator [Paenibacillus nasutitermitis]GGD51723.1 AraC family transcriptional regulator [Paenibacillus nasutitermitis]